MKLKHYILLAVAVALVVAISLGYFFLIRDVAPGINLQQSHGYFGDMFGGLNALFSGLAFAIILFTLFYQQEEIRDQSKRIEDQNDRLERQLSEMQNQSKALLAAANAQKASLVASISAMRIEMLKSGIEAEKMGAAKWIPGTAQYNAHQGSIADTVVQMRKLIDSVEEQIKKEA